MLTNLEVFTTGISAPPIPIVDQDVSLDSIQIKNIDGLGPVKANVNSTPYGSADGESLDGTSTPKRNIVLTVKLNPNWASLSIEALRMILYSYFMPENTVRLRFSSTHMPTVEIIGVVESCDPNLFAKDAEYQISIICVNPYFLSIVQTIVNGTTVALSDTSSVQVDYQGNIDTGFVLDVSIPSSGSLPGGATSGTPELRVLNYFPSTALWIGTAMGQIDTTHEFRLSTVDGNKFAKLYPIPESNPTNLLNRVSPGSLWPKLKKGSNKIQVLTTAPGYAWQLSYYARYGGL